MKPQNDLLLSVVGLLTVLGCGSSRPATDGGAPDDAGVRESGVDAVAVDDDGAVDAEVAPEGERGEECTTSSASLASALRKRSRELDRRSLALDDREHSLGLLEKAIDERLAALEKTRDVAAAEVDRLASLRAGECVQYEEACAEKINALRVEYGELERGLEQWDRVQQERAKAALNTEVATLSKALSTMRPEKAAATLEALDSDVAATLLKELPDRASGKILASLSPSAAAGIVSALLKRTSGHDREDLRAAAAEAEPAATSSSEEARQ